MRSRNFSTWIQVRLIEPGDGYGRNGCLKSGIPLVEFHDRTQDPAKFPGGCQFVSRYYLETILAHTGALCLHGCVPTWDVPAKVISEIQAWLVDLGGELGLDEQT